MHGGFTAAGVTVVALLSVPPAPHDPTFSRVRPLDARTNELLVDGWRSAQTIRTLIDAIEASDLIVHITSDPFLPQRGQVRLLGATRTCRYVRVCVRAPGPRTRVIAILAHELQHAVEIAQSPDVRTEQDLWELFRHIGWVVRNAGAPCFETQAAMNVETQVRLELAAGPDPGRP